MKSTLFITVILGLSSAYAQSSSNTAALIIPNKEHLNLVLQNLRTNGFNIPENATCSAQAQAVEVVISEDTKQIQIICRDGNYLSSARAVSLKKSEAVASTKGDLNELDVTLDDPNELEGNAGGDPNELEGHATGVKAGNKSFLVRALGRIEAAARSANAKVYRIIMGN